MFSGTNSGAAMNWHKMVILLRNVHARHGGHSCRRAPEICWIHHGGCGLVEYQGQTGSVGLIQNQNLVFNLLTNESTISYGIV